MDSCGSIQGEHEFHNELQLASRIDTTNHVVSILGFSSCDELSARRRKRRKRLLLIYEYMPNGSLQDALLDRKCPELMIWKKRYSIAIDIAKGIEYLHYSCNPPIVHGDIKPSNVLLDLAFNAKIADFGLAKSLSEEENEINKTVIECDGEGVNQGKGKEGADIGDDNGSILEETESVMTEEVIVNIDLSPEVAFSPELGGNDASPSEKLDKASVTESCFDIASVDSCNRKGITRKKSESGRDWWWKQDNRGFGSDSARIKDYVMEWIGSEIKKERPKNEPTPSSLEEGSMVKPEQKKPKKNRKPREWWKEEFCEELTKKSKKKRGLKSGAGVEQWWQRDDDFTPERKKGKKRSSRGSIDWWLDGFSGEFRSGRRNSQEWPSGEIPKSGGISSTPSMRGTVCYIAPECGGGQFSEKCDVYSFGVLLLVLVSGRRPLQVTASPMSEFERANLISWARQLARNGKLLELVDPKVQCLDSEQAMLCITIALLCLQRVPTRRPTMRDIVGMLTGDSDPPHLPFEFSPSPPINSPFKPHKKAR